MKHSKKSKDHALDLKEEFFENFSSKHTRLSYKTDIRQFFHFLKEREPHIRDFSEVLRLHVIQYRNWLCEFAGKDGGASAPKTVARKLASISSYFDYLVERNFAESNPATSVKRPRREVVSPTHALSSEQVRSLLNSIDLEKESGILHQALIITFFTTGLRKSEILYLKRKNLKKMGDHHIIEYAGKGGKLGQKLLHPLCINSLEVYLNSMIKQGREHIAEDWLFQPTKNTSGHRELNKPLNPKTINEILQNYARKAELNLKICPHSARATFISELLNKGVDIYTIANEVNHSSVKTTQEYDKRRRKLLDSPVHKLKY